ncbi:hypothetical protein [Proteiniborus sp. MB09-C3]|uniref:hypothetical protein n=1 Tax=Proteiniborus sp. MB09-C3 TaxID=3050072 RepID=UPI00255785A9|nr:hypothetical protein [Proteiniborus sp. MB09-C3]WIV11423.1 hypothetical protein QO263_15175 [Proteiniborus sp. MB09-C3]
MTDIRDIKEIERKLVELSSAFIILFDNLKAKGIISQEEYDAHTMVKRDFLHRISNNH